MMKKLNSQNAAQDPIRQYLPPPCVTRCRRVCATESPYAIENADMTFV